VGEEYQVPCSECGETVCRDDVTACTVCDDAVCADHHETTALDEVSLCVEHVNTEATTVPFDGTVLDRHTDSCSDCGVTNAERRLEDGHCRTCRELHEGTTVSELPEYVDDSLSPDAAAANDEYLVVRSLGVASVTTVVYDTETGDEHNTERGGVVARLKEVFR
jgi:hypothetical protein